MSLINKAKVKQVALELAASRAHKFTRVSATLYEEVESVVRRFLEDKIKGLPSAGKTIK